MKLPNSQYRTRDKSLITDGELEELYIIKDFPVYIGSTNEPRESDLFHDMIFDICKTTGFVQGRDVINEDLIYSKFHSESIGEVWDNHREEFTDLVLKYGKQDNSLLEIGGSDGRMSKILLEKSSDINHISIVEPSIKKKIITPRLKYFEEYLDKNTWKKHTGYDIIFHSHVFEHVHNPMQFIEIISSMLSYGKYHIFAVPNLLAYYKNKYSNVLNFEHTMLLTEHIIDYILSINDFATIEKKYFLNHGIFYVTKKQKTISNHIPDSYNENRDIVLKYFDHFKTLVNSINTILNTTDKDVYIFGGHVFSQFLIALGLNTEKIKNVLDNSDLKHNSRLYGTDLIIKKPESCGLNENSLVILHVGQYEDEIKTQLLKINKNIEFI